MTTITEQPILKVDLVPEDFDPCQFVREQIARSGYAWDICFSAYKLFAPGFNGIREKLWLYGELIKITHETEGELNGKAPL